MSVFAMVLLMMVVFPVAASPTIARVIVRSRSMKLATVIEIGDGIRPESRRVVAANRAA